jgi:isoleucyl-tRNA synthetase
MRQVKWVPGGNGDEALPERFHAIYRGRLQMTELVKQLAEKLEGHGIWALLTTIMSVILATLISKYLDSRWKHTYDQDMEQFKARLEQDRLVFNTALSSLNSAAAAVNPKIVASVETIWQAILKVRDASFPIGFYADILTKEEWCELPNNPRQRERVAAIANAGDARQHLLEELANAEHSRPFVGELIWSMFFVYRALLLRVAVIVERDFAKGHLSYWYDDPGIQQFIKLLLTEETAMWELAERA